MRSTNAPVMPEPVWAPPITSRPVCWLSGAGRSATTALVYDALALFTGRVRPASIADATATPELRRDAWELRLTTPELRRDAWELRLTTPTLLAEGIGPGGPQSTGTSPSPRHRRSLRRSSPAFLSSSALAVNSISFLVSCCSSWRPRHSLSPSGLSPPRPPVPAAARPRRRPISGDLPEAAPPPNCSSQARASNALSRAPGRAPQHRRCSSPAPATVC
ncbi:hypothetical protein QYE76_036144 [Lolium multiflorum]|uniref:Uncharacterized protein n=1 Tax=Lolium multiflorum TaxID=4521 RepID=A0AAD8VP44_LOLMU|nr:hypothetical protein QYE76_036144 [Lolium multiflorum]